MCVRCRTTDTREIAGSPGRGRRGSGRGGDVCRSRSSKNISSTCTTSLLGQAQGARDRPRRRCSLDAASALARDSLTRAAAGVHAPAGGCAAPSARSTHPRRSSDTSSDGGRGATAACPPRGPAARSADCGQGQGSGSGHRPRPRLAGIAPGSRPEPAERTTACTYRVRHRVKKAAPPPLAIGIARRRPSAAERVGRLLLPDCRHPAVPADDCAPSERSR